MNYQEYVKYDAIGLSNLVKNKEVSAEKLLEIAINRAEAVNPLINAFTHKLYDMGRQMIKEANPEAPFYGVPSLVKDLGIHIKGFPLTAGSNAVQNYICTKDSELGAKLKAAGFIFFGKTNSPELGLTPYTEPKRFGATLNPWNTKHSAGGSSGGSAAAVAAGIVPIATASDGGGSIRIPASACGLVGLKPTRGRVPLGEFTAEVWSGAVCENCVSRSVRDTAAFLDAMHGPQLGATHLIKPPTMPYLQAIEQAPAPLRIGYSLEHPLGKGKTIDNECINAIKHTVELLKSAGHTVHEIPLPYHRDNLLKHFALVVFGETAAMLQEASEELGLDHSAVNLLELNTWFIWRLGLIYTAKDQVYYKRKWHEIAYNMGVFHQKYDLLLTPTLSRPPIKTGELQNSAVEAQSLKLLKKLKIERALLPILPKIVEKIASKSFSYIPHTPIANMTGQPSISLPLYHNTKNNLPVGVMFTARLCEEDTLLQLAHQLEKMQPWFNKMPIL